MFKRKDQTDIEPSAMLSRCLPESHRAAAVVKYIDGGDFRCQICNGFLFASTVVHRRAWHRCDEEHRNYIHADARKCLSELRLQLNRHENAPHGTKG